MVNTPAMQRGQKQTNPRIAEEEVQQALLQADTRHDDAFLKALNEVAAILTKNPDCFGEQRTAFAAVTRHVPLGPFENRFFALYLHSHFVGNKFHELTDERRKLEAKLDAELNPVRRGELERELDQHIPPIEKQHLNISDLEKFAGLSSRAPKRSSRERTRRLRVGPWHLPMTGADYQARLGLSRKAVQAVMDRLDPEAKRLPQSRRNEPTRYPPETNWRVLRQFLLVTKKSPEWKRDFHLSLRDYYLLHRCDTPNNKDQIRKAFEGIKMSPIPPEERTATVDYSLPATPAPAADIFTAAIQGKF
jgi:hypothetical protein